MQKQKNKQRGITLIALVVTIIVLIILAGVSIAMLVGENGIITQAQRASQETEQAQEEEQRQLAILEAAMNTENRPYTDKNGDTATIPAGFAVSQVDGENTINDGLVIIDKDGNEFVWIEVANDGTGPNYSNVTNSTDYTNIDNALKEYCKKYTNTTHKDVYYNGCGIKNESEYINLYNQMLRSIYVKGGFYIGRYETGIDYSQNYRVEASTILQTPVVKSNAYPYNYVTCSQAQSLATQFSSNDRNSSLMFGIQLALTMKFLENKGTPETEIFESSENWGNYYNATFDINNIFAKYSNNNGQFWNSIKVYSKEAGSNILLTTGANKIRNSKQNICDLAGNVYEYLLQYTTDGSKPCAVIGGNYNNQVTGSSAILYRNAVEIEYSNYDLGFRIAIY